MNMLSMLMVERVAIPPAFSFAVHLFLWFYYMLEYSISNPTVCCSLLCVNVFRFKLAFDIEKLLRSLFTMHTDVSRIISSAAAILLSLPSVTSVTHSNASHSSYELNMIYCNDESSSKNEKTAKISAPHCILYTKFSQS